MWHTLKRSCEHYCSVGTSIHIYDGSCIDVYYKLGIDMDEQTVEKSHVACVENNYKKIIKNKNKKKRWPLYVILCTKVPNIIECPELIFTYMIVSTYV